MRAQSGALILFLTGMFWNLSNDVQHVGLAEVTGRLCGGFVGCLFARVVVAYSFISPELFECLYDA